MKCGLLGRKLGHSYSHQIHACLGDYSYTLFEKEPEEVEDFLKSGDFTGLNVTIPYKKTVIPYLAELSPNAKKLGAVNTIVRRKDGTLFGHNTDYFGFASLLKRSGLDVAGKKVLVLGSGGASNTVTAVLTGLGAEAVVISRSGENNYENLQRHEDAAVIVNATPVGMYPNTGVSPVDLKRFPKLEGVLDVIYNPARTQLLLDAEALHIPCANGLWMLVAQAKESAEYFTGTSIDDAAIAEIHANLAAQMANIVQPRNYPMLHQNGVIFWLKRDISKLPTDGRPLSQTNPLDAMFAKRAPMYAAFADHAASNDGSAEETVASILSIMEEPI